MNNHTFCFINTIIVVISIFITLHLFYSHDRSRERIISTPSKNLDLNQYPVDTNTPQHPSYTGKHVEHNYSPENEYAYIADLPHAPPNCNSDQPDIYHEQSLARSVIETSTYGATRHSVMGPCGHNIPSRPGPEPPKYFELDPSRTSAIPPVKPVRTFVVQGNHLIPANDTHTHGYTEHGFQGPGVTDHTKSSNNGLHLSM